MPAARAGNGSVAYDYYWNGKEVEGKTFGGFKTANRRGLPRRVRPRAHDARLEHDPGARHPQPAHARAQGHLRRPLAGRPAHRGLRELGLRRQAGDRHRRGLQPVRRTGRPRYHALRQRGGQRRARGRRRARAGRRKRRRALRRRSAADAGDDPDPLGLRRRRLHQPDGTNMLRDLPHSTNLDLSQKVLFSRDAANFATGMPSIRDFTITNEATLAGVLDDNSAGLSFLRASVGFSTGGRTPTRTSRLPAAASSRSRRSPRPRSTRGSTTTTWAPAAPPLELNDDGQPYTSREGEVSDIHQFARAMFEGPANFVEQYFPTRMLVDVVAAGEGDRSGSLAGLRYNGPSKRPALLIQAGDSDDNSPDDTGPPKSRRPAERQAAQPRGDHPRLQPSGRGHGRPCRRTTAGPSPAAPPSRTSRSRWSPPRRFAWPCDRAGCPAAAGCACASTPGRARPAAAAACSSESAAAACARTGAAAPC